MSRMFPFQTEETSLTEIYRCTVVVKLGIPILSVSFLFILNNDHLRSEVACFLVLFFPTWKELIVNYTVRLLLRNEKWHEPFPKVPNKELSESLNDPLIVLPVIFIEDMFV